ncbi:response regulator [Microbacterium sp.]|uniref:response regulator n=1 Tax=Microbacterium sp. TaxID=51671 RepID=UPI00356A98B1
MLPSTLRAVPYRSRNHGPRARDRAERARYREQVSAPVRVLVVDDDALVRHALRAFITDDPRVALVGEATDGSEVVEACAAVKPDVVLMDIKMKNVSGVEATRRLLEWDPRCRVVALTTFTTEWRALEVLRAGACGYLVKHSTPEQIVDAVVAAHTGDRVVSPEVQDRFVRAAIEAGDGDRSDLPLLSDRERQVIELIAAGLSNTEIADELHYAEGTVKADIRHINHLWGVENRLQIVLRATELGVISL